MLLFIWYKMETETRNNNEQQQLTCGLLLRYVANIFRIVHYWFTINSFMLVLWQFWEYSNKAFICFSASHTQLCPTTFKRSLFFSFSYIIVVSVEQNFQSSSAYRYVYVCDWTILWEKSPITMCFLYVIWIHNHFCLELQCVYLGIVWNYNIHFGKCSAVTWFCLYYFRGWEDR